MTTRGMTKLTLIRLITTMLTYGDVMTVRRSRRRGRIMPGRENFDSEHRKIMDCTHA